MKTDLSLTTGFPLFFDPETLALETGPHYRLNRSSRFLRDIVEVLYAPNSLPADQLAFHLDHIEKAPANEAKILAENDLAFGFTLLPALKIGLEYVKTHGHSHPPVKGYLFSFPEIYAQISGNMALFLQKHQPDNLAVIEDCVLIRMKPGDTVLIPPNHAHMQINLSESEPSLTVGLYSRLFKPEFAFYKQKKGFAYYLLEGKEPYKAERNPNYPKPPPLRQLEQTAATPFEAIDSSQPLWSSLIQDPKQYTFLSRPEETARKFNLS